MSSAGEKQSYTKNNSFIFQDENISNTNVSQQNERIASPTLYQNPDLLVEEIQPLNIKQEEPESSKDILEDAQIYTIEKTELSQIKDAQKEAEMTEENELDHIIELHEEHDQTDRRQPQANPIPPHASRQAEVMRLLLKLLPQRGGRRRR